MRFSARFSAKFLPRLIVVGALVGAGAFAVPAAAHAEPTDCTLTNPGPRSVAVTCSGGAGEYRVVAYCSIVRADRPPMEWVEYGAWVDIFWPSVQTCGNRTPEGGYEWWPR